MTTLEKKKSRFTRKTKAATAVAIVVILLVSFFALAPIHIWFPANWFGGEKSTLLASSRAVDNVVWRGVASNAWAYFQPGIGVDSKTGLPYAGASDFKGFTDWDLAYIFNRLLMPKKLG